MDKTIKVLQGRFILLLVAAFVAGVDAMLLTYRFWQAEMPYIIVILVIAVLGLSIFQIASQLYVVHKSHVKDGDHYLFKFEAMSHVFWIPVNRFVIILGASAMLGAQLTLLFLSFDNTTSLISATFGSSAMVLLLFSQLRDKIKIVVKSKQKVK